MDVKATLNSKTVTELRQLAAQRHIARRSTMKKAELIDALIASDVESVLAIEQITPEQQAAYAAEYNAAKAKRDAVSNSGEVAILRDAPGTAIVTAAFDGRTVGGTIVRKGKRLMLVAGHIKITGNSFEKVAKLFAKRLGFRAEIIDVAQAL